MTHTALIKTIAQKIGLKPAEVAILWQQTSHLLTRELAKQEKVRIKNFGAFVTVKHKSRTVPDPRQMSQKLVIFDQFLPKFRPSEQLRGLVKDVTPLETISEPELESKPELTEAPPIEKSPTEQPASEMKPAIEIKPKPKAKDKQAAAILPKPIDIGYADLSNLTVDPTTLNLVPYRLANKYQLVPIEKDDKELKVAMIDPGDREAIDLVSRETGLTIKPAITTQSELQHVLDQYDTGTELEATVEGETTTDEKGDKTPKSTSADTEQEATTTDSPAAKIVTNVFERAVREKASDIHIEPEETKIVVRYRIDGILQKIIELPKNIQASLISRLKIMANLKIDESRLPQDGRIRLVIDKKEIDFRVSTLPTVAGEKVVMRILDKSAGVLSFKDLGVTGRNLERTEDNLTKAHGMILVTGPTGSGKTTTLYAMIGKLMSPGVNIVTLEDPVEYRIPGINQSQVNPAIKYDFANGLRTIVRQDPDIILIGEIRDLETATMAIHSALTGHIVLSTLHTNDAAGAIPRLIDMGIEPFLITSSTNAVIAQRLVRRICQHCKAKVELPEEALTEVRKELEAMPADLKTTDQKDQKLVFYQGKGCAQCNKSGYSGRFGIYEVLSVTEAIKLLALKRVSASELTAAAISEGMLTMKQDGVTKALAGETTLEEVWRVTKD